MCAPCQRYQKRSKPLAEGCGLTDDEEEDKADDEERGAADGHPASKLDERREQQRGPEQEVEQRPGPAGRDNCRSGKPSHLVVVFLQGVLTTSGQRRSVSHNSKKIKNKIKFKAR